MKKLLIALAAGALLVQACNKEYDKVSEVKTVSYPTITFSGIPYYSINTGGDVPKVIATAYDSLLKESDSVSIVGTDAIDNTTPGLYIINAKATNRLGFYSTSDIYVAVTDIPATTDISGKYVRAATGGINTVTKLARGLYQMDNLGGVANTAANASLLFPVLFVQADDTTLLIPPQATAAGNIAVKDEYNTPDQAILHRAPADTNFKYAITSGSPFGTAVRTFKKQ